MCKYNPFLEEISVNSQSYYLKFDDAIVSEAVLFIGMCRDGYFVEHDKVNMQTNFKIFKELMF